MSKIKPFAFVLMPFDAKFRDIYNLGIKETASESGIVAERVDEQHFSESMLERIYRQIEAADFIIADMTGKNANVFYEVGYAHAKGKLCTLMTQDAADIPFDLKHHAHVVYDGSITDLKIKLVPKLEWMKAEIKKQKTETISFSMKTFGGNLEKTDYYHTGSLNFELNLKNNSNQKSPEIEAIYISMSKPWTVSQDNSNCPSEIEGNKVRCFVSPKLTRLSPNAFSKILLKAERSFWTKWSGSEEKDEYVAKGSVHVEIVTSEGTFEHNVHIEATMEEFPF